MLLRLTSLYKILTQNYKSIQICKMIFFTFVWSGCWMHRACHTLSKQYVRKCIRKKSDWNYICTALVVDCRFAHCAVLTTTNFRISFAIREHFSTIWIVDHFCFELEIAYFKVIATEDFWFDFHTTKWMFLINIWKLKIQNQRTQNWYAKPKISVILLRIHSFVCTAFNSSLIHS